MSSRTLAVMLGTPTLVILTALAVLQRITVGEAGIVLVFLVLCLVLVVVPRRNSLHHKRE